MSYNWTSASTPQGRERFKELMDKGVTVICRSVDGMHDDDPYFVEPDYNIQADVALDYLEFIEPQQQPDENGLLPTDDEIHFVAVDESNSDRHGWISLNQKPAYVDGFEDGAKWMRNKKKI